MYACSDNGSGLAVCPGALVMGWRSIVPSSATVIAADPASNAAVMAVNSALALMAASDSLECVVHGA